MILSALAFSLQLTHAQLHSEATLEHRILNEESQGSGCADAFPPTAFFVHGVGYLKYETAPGSFDVPPNSSQIGFEVVNKANDVGTACSFVTAMVNGEYPNTNHLWHDCGNRSLDIDGEETPLRTSARFNWDTWDLAVNQSWMCDEGETIKQISTAALTPTCRDSNTPYQFVKSCNASDIEAPAISQ